MVRLSALLASLLGCITHPASVVESYASHAAYKRNFTITMVTSTPIVTSSTNFLQRDVLYEVEKPYSLRFTPPSAFPRSNIRLENHSIHIKDVRTRSEPLDFLQHGFQILPFHSQLPYADFDDDELVKRVYLLEAANLITKFLGATKVQIFEHTVRKRHETFPISTGEAYRWNQPTSIAHVDTTVTWAVAMAKQLNSDIRDIGKQRIQCVKLVFSCRYGGYAMLIERS
jgi:hypothetical protein